MHEVKFVVSLGGEFAQFANGVFMAGNDAAPDERTVGEFFEDVVIAFHGCSFAGWTVVSWALTNCRIELSWAAAGDQLGLVAVETIVAREAKWGTTGMQGFWAATLSTEAC